MAQNIQIRFSMHICVGAGKFWGVRKDFSRISPNLPENFSGNFLCEYFRSWRPFLGMTCKKTSSS